MCTPFSLAALFTIAKKFKQPKRFKQNVVSKYSGILFIKILTHATSMNLKDMMLSEIRQTQNGKYYHSIYMSYLGT